MTDDAGRGDKDQIIGNAECCGSSLRNGQGVLKSLRSGCGVRYAAVDDHRLGDSRPDPLLIEKDRRRLEAVRRENPGRLRRPGREEQCQVPTAVRLDSRVNSVGEKSGNAIHL